jgi:hypothetical protein
VRIRWVELRGLVWVPAGEFLIGLGSQYPEEAPAHRVAVAGFLDGLVRGHILCRVKAGGFWG